MELSCQNDTEYNHRSMMNSTAKSEGLEAKLEQGSSLARWGNDDHQRYNHNLSSTVKRTDHLGCSPAYSTGTETDEKTDEFCFRTA